MKRYLLFFLLTAGGSTALRAQSLQTFIDEGLKSNPVVREKTLSVDAAMLALKEAKSLFLPSSHFETQYTLARGGRTITIPVADLMTPVYKTLSQMTGTTHEVPLKNMSEAFLPNNFYDVRVKTTMPLINPELKANRAIRTSETGMKELELATYKRELVKEIKVAYYNYLMATHGIGIYQNLLQLAAQNLKSSQALVANGKGLPAFVARATFELKAVQEQQQVAALQQQNARAYLNFLVNKPLGDSVLAVEDSLADLLSQTAALAPAGTPGREELKALAAAQDIYRHKLKASKAYRTPRLNAFLDLGAQDFDFKVQSQSLLYFGGLQLKVPLFTGGRNQLQVRQSLLELETITLQKEHVQQQLSLAALVARNNLQAAESNYRLSEDKLAPAESYYHLVSRGFGEGTHSFLELMDAQVKLTDTRLQINLTKYKLLSAKAEYERQSATYPLN
ncbi:TolC family protein [Paraflavisolibacter sp. H34]|uniref:TolC family protein n=1 Tax=Huijunlia imazamoxiresistens TaxID=3127457 RepID=UPI00301A95E1